MIATVVAGYPYKRPEAWRLVHVFVAGLDRLGVEHWMTESRERVFTTPRPGYPAGAGAVLYKIQLRDRENYRLFCEFAQLTVRDFAESLESAPDTVD